MKVRDKGFGNISVYVEEGYGLTFEDFTEEETASYMTHWELSTPNGLVEGFDVPELIEALKNIVASNCLHYYNEKKTSKDIVIIYTDRFNELYYYLYNYVTEDFEMYFQVLDHIEFRGCWNCELHKAKDIADWAKEMIDTLFTKDKYFYLTPSQISRKRIQWKCKETKNTIGPDIFPNCLDLYNYYRGALYGGICYCPFPGEVFERPIIEVDLKSAYIYCFILRHCMTAGKWSKHPENWERYLDDEYKYSIGEYKITYSCWSKKIKCFKTIEGYEPVMDNAVGTDTFLFDNMDLKLFLETANVQKVECLGLVEFDTDYLPKEVLDVVLELYMKKEHSTGIEKEINKVATNSTYGNTARKYRTEQEFKNAYKYLPTQWGVFITSYCKKLLIGLGNQLEGWIYSDTDSIFCFDTPENIEKIENFNKKTRKVVKDFCDRFGYPYKELEKLGCFVVKEHITKFKAWKQKQYAYKPVGSKTVEAVASGCEKRHDWTDNLFDETKGVPIGEKVVEINPVLEKHTCIKDGKEYTSETSYWKKTLDGEEAMMYLAIKKLVYDDLDYNS